jgi:hypothetical protein
LANLTKSFLSEGLKYGNLNLSELLSGFIIVNQYNTSALLETISISDGESIANNVSSPLLFVLMSDMNATDGNLDTNLAVSSLNISSII